jgi:hypothetical protein
MLHARAQALHFLHPHRVRLLMRTFADLAEKLKMDVTDLMRQCNDPTMPAKSRTQALWTGKESGQTADPAVGTSRSRTQRMVVA